MEVEFVVNNLNADVDKRVLLVADAVLEGILHKGDHHQGRNIAFGDDLGNIYADIHLIDYAHTHQLNVVVEENHLATQGYLLLGTFIEHETHNLR